MDAVPLSAGYELHSPHTFAVLLSILYTATTRVSAKCRARPVVPDGNSLVGLSTRKSAYSDAREHDARDRSEIADGTSRSDRDYESIHRITQSIMMKDFKRKFEKHRTMLIKTRVREDFLLKLLSATLCKFIPFQFSSSRCKL